MERQIREYEFAGFRLNVLKRQLRNARNQALELPARAFDTLVFLIEHRHEIVGKDQIMKAVWPDTVVEENNLNQAIFSLSSRCVAPSGIPQTMRDSS
jgi:DNA-binding winged helix-turn-helix (wHTH) protein